MENPSRRRYAFLIPFVALAVVRVAAHTLPLQTVAYLKVEGSVLHMLVRLPLATLADARIPLGVSGGLDLGAIRPTMDAAAADFVKSADVMDGGRPLAAPSVAWVVSPGADESFATYQAAAVHLSAPASAETEIGVNDGFVDLKLDYPLASAAPRIAVRFNGQRVGGSFLPTRASYLSDSGGERRLTIVGGPRRVSFEPSGLEAARMFLALGVGRLLDERQLLLFLLCLAIPQRAIGSILRAAAITLTAYFAAGAVVSIAPSLVGDRLRIAMQMTASAALVLAALQNLVTPRAAWIWTVCIGFGLASGVTAGVGLSEVLALAGGHAVVGLVLFLGVVLGGAFLATPFLRLVLAAFFRLPISRQAVTILLSLVPLHAGLHALQNSGWRLVDPSMNRGGGPGAALIANWPPVVAVMSLMVIAVVARMGPSEPSQPSEPRQPRELLE